MLAVVSAERELLPLLDENLSVSLINGPELCVVAGPVEAMRDLQENLERRNVTFRPVRNAHAFHSRMLDPIVDAFVAEASKVRFNRPQVPFISNVTGTWITEEQAVDPRYWGEHARRTARFSDALAQLWSKPESLVLELGPGRTLGVLAMQHPARSVRSNPVVVSSLRHDYENQPDAELMLKSAGRLWLAGARIAWDKVDGRSARRRVSLPTYPFERQRHWIESPGESKAPATAATKAERRADIADWFYVPSWQRTAFRAQDHGPAAWKGSHWLIIAEESGLATRFRDALVEQGATVALACFGDSYVQRSDGVFEIGPACLDDYLKLLGGLKARLGPALNVLHLGCLSPRLETAAQGLRRDGLDQDVGFYSLVSLAKAIGEKDISIPVRLGVVTRGVHEVTGEEALDPRMATVLGPCGVIPKEYASVTSFSVDVPMSPRGAHVVGDSCLLRVLAEFREPLRGGVIAHRGRYRWERSYRPLRLPPVTVSDQTDAPSALPFRHRGVYLITGGTGGIGLVLARYLAEKCQARLVLTKKTPFPPKAEWRRRLADGDLSDSDRQVVTDILEIESLGAEVDVFTCEASDRDGLQRVVSQTMLRYKGIHGVIHAAGIVRAGLIQAKTREVAESVLAPKIHGTAILYDLVKDLQVDFLVLLSSITSVITPYAEVDYSAANSFLDAFSCFSNSEGRLRAVCINWPGWREVGQLAKLKVQTGVEAWKEQALKKAIVTSDGLEAFERILASHLSHVIVSPEDLEGLLEESRKPVDISEYLSEPSVAAAPASPARRGIDASELPRNDLENLIAETWKKVLGIGDVGVGENFFDLGGHSLLLIRVHTELRRALNREISIISLFEHPTIGALAGHLAAGESEAPAAPSAQERAARFKRAFAKQRGAPRR